MAQISIALSKGRIFEETAPLLERAGIGPKPEPEGSRKLVLATHRRDVQLTVELAPLAGLADAIVDLVSTGNTLRANRLVAVEQIMPVSARLIVNQAALRTKRAALQPLIDAFSRAAGR